MDFDTRAAHRKSRAPWQASQAKAKSVNPYAAANTSLVSNDDGHSIYGGGNMAAPSIYEGGAGNGSNTSLLVPGTAKSRKTNRRMSIHASASAAGHGRPDMANLPPVPNLYRTGTNNLEAMLMFSAKEEKDEFANIEARIITELSSGTASEIDDYYKVLVKQKALLDRDIKANINQNQRNILELTNDLKATQEELLHLRITTKELYGVLSDFTDAAERRLELEHEVPQSQPQAQARTKSGSSLQLPGKRKDRSSILVVEKMWASELQSLFKHVEGASKYIQAIPGRHVLAESGRWHEVNIGTWKPTRNTHLFVLNDLVLVTAKKSSSGQEGGNSKRRLQAIHCWPLHDVKLTEISVPVTTSNSKSDDNKVYTINIRAKSLSYVYQTDRYDHFLKITDAYNKGKNEILQKDRLLDARKSITPLTDIAETDEEKKQLRESFRNSGIKDDDAEKRHSGHHRQSSDHLLQDISARVHSRNRSLDVGRNKSIRDPGDNSKYFLDLKSIEDRLDEVDVEIAHNKSVESVGLIKHIENKLSSIESAVTTNSKKEVADEEIKLLIDVIRLKITNRKFKVQQSLSFELQHNIARLDNGQISQIIEFFLMFDQLEKGIGSYLAAMSSHLAATLARLVTGVQGSTRIDVVNYLSNLVIINVSIIKRAVSVYEDCIVPILRRTKSVDLDSSGFISWCIDEVAKLVGTIKKHLHGTLISSVETQEGVHIYTVKDAQNFGEFVAVVQPQLNELKKVGVNVEFLFDDILLLQA